MTIPQRILLHVALGAGLVIAVATGVTYAIVFANSKQGDLKHLATYVTERARREDIGFQQIEANLLLVRGQFLKRMEAPIPRDVDQRWNARFELFPDGSWRSKTNFADGRKHATLWAHKECALTPELQVEVLRAQDICNELLPGWVDAFPSVYFVLPAGPGWLNIGFDPRIPNWVWDTPADYNATNLEWFHLAMPAGTPRDVFGWTGIIEEPTTKVPIVSIYVPIFKDGQLIGSIGHDEYVNRMMDEITHSDLPGARHVIFRADGRIVAHPTKLKAILASKGQLRMQDSGEPDLASLYRSISPREERTFSGFDEGSGCYYSVARLSGPEWFFLTTMPREQLQRQAFQSAQWVLWSGLASLALMLGFLQITLRRQIAAPLTELARATKQMSGGDVSARASVERDDELGALAGSFNEMAGRVASRDAELQAEKASLERRVAERTTELRESEARFVTAFRHSPAMQSLIRGSDRVLVEVNDTFLSKLGFAREQVIGKAAPELDFWADPGELAAFAQELESKGFVLGREVRLRASDGRALMVLISTQPVDIGGALHFLSAAVDITARKEAEARLIASERQFRESEARLSTVFRASPTAVSLGRLQDGRFVAVNEAFVKVTGFVESEIIGKNSLELGLYAHLEERAAFFEKIKASGFVRDYEYGLRTKQGQMRSMVMSAEMVEVDGEPHILAVASDISSRKEAEERLRESEARFGTAFQTSPVLMTIARLEDGKFVEVNPAFMRHIGLERSDIIGRDSQELRLWVDLQARADFFRRLKRDRVVRNVEAQIRAHNGTIHRMQISGEIIEINREPHLITFALDISDQKRAEQVLRESEARTRDLYETISAAAMVQDEKGFLQVNSAAVKLFGAQRREEIVGRHPGEVSPPTQPDGESSFEAARRHMARALAEGMHRFQWVCRKLDGTDFPVEVTLTALQLEGRRVIQAVVLDLTERRRAEAELLKTLERERELSELKSNFVSLVSHEFRTPLEIIMSSVDNLDRYHERLAAGKRQQLLHTINKAVRRMAGMMEEVLVLGRLETDRVTFKPAELELRSLSRRLCDEIESATNRRCPIHLDVNGTPDFATGDESLLRHIFTNLLSNAVKYSPPDRTVDFVIRREGDAAVCRVTDRGCGIPQADQKRLFQAFHRGSNVQQIPGTGLGLLIVQRCVDLHGGDIQFESVEGRGTTFTVRLPLFMNPPEPDAAI